MSEWDACYSAFRAIAHLPLGIQIAPFGLLGGILVWMLWHGLDQRHPYKTLYLLGATGTYLFAIFASFQVAFCWKEHVFG